MELVLKNWKSSLYIAIQQTSNPLFNYQSVNLYTTPENPMNAIASRPAVIKAIGVPCIPFGTFTRLICSRNAGKKNQCQAETNSRGECINTHPSADHSLSG